MCKLAQIGTSNCSTNASTNRAPSQQPPPIAAAPIEAREAAEGEGDLEGGEEGQCQGRMKVKVGSSSEASLALAALLALLVLLAAAGSLQQPVGQAEAKGIFKRSFAGLGCLGVYDKAKFARLDRVCEECYQLYREPDIHTACR